MTNDEGFDKFLTDAMTPPMDKAGPQPPPPILVLPHVADNVCKMLERVTVTGMEALAWVEAYQVLQQIAVTNRPGTGIPFAGLGK